MAHPDSRMITPEIRKYWNFYAQNRDDENMFVFIKVFLETYGDVLDQRKEGARVRGPSLRELPEGLLSALGQQFKKCRRDFEQPMEQHVLGEVEAILQTLCIICQNFDSIPFLASCDFVSDVISILNSILQCANIGGECPFSTESMLVLNAGLSFLECMYDPYSNWSAFLNGCKYNVAKQQYSPSVLHTEVIPFFYDCFQIAPVQMPISIVNHCLHLFGAILSGTKHNALIAATPATLQVILECIRDERLKSHIRDLALDCFHQFALTMLRLKPDETQVDRVAMMEEFCKLWLALSQKESVLSDVVFATKILDKLKKMLNCAQKSLLQSILGQVGWLESLLDVFQVCSLQVLCEEVENLSVTILQTICALLQGNKEVKSVMSNINGYERILETMKVLSHSPSMHLLQALVSLACDENCGHLYQKTFPKVCVQPEGAKMCYQFLEHIQSPDLQHWLADKLMEICTRLMNSRILCCEAGMTSAIIRVLKNVPHSNSAVSLIKTIEKLGCYSITPMELKELILLLRPSEYKGSQYPYTNYVMHAMSSMAKKKRDATYFFDFQDPYDGIIVPTAIKWPGYGFTFHAWVRLNEVSHSDKAVPLYRRQLYSLSNESGCGFEAFFIPDGTLVVAVLSKKEYVTVSINEHPINDGNWHAITVCHLASRRPFVQSHVTVYIDGTQRQNVNFKCAPFSEPFTHCSICSGRHKIGTGSNADLTSPTTAERLLSNLPNFLSMTLPTKSSTSHGQGIASLPAGMQDKVWGKPCSLLGQLGLACMFNESLPLGQVRCLYAVGPNNLMIFSVEDVDTAELSSKLVLFYHAKACEDNICTDVSSTRLYNGNVTGHRCATYTIKDSISCIGGLQVLYPLLEHARIVTNQATPDDVTSPSNSSVSEEDMEEWVVLPSSAFSEWKLEQNQTAGFLIILINIIQDNATNQELLLSKNGLAIIGALLQKIPASLVNTDLLMACQLLLESSCVKDETSLRHLFYQHILFEFRIWSKSDFPVRIGHIQYISSLIKNDKKYFRKKYGVSFFLDVVKQFYSSHATNLCQADCKLIRVSLLNLVRYFVLRDASSKEIESILGFLFSVKEEEMLTDMLEMLIKMLVKQQQCQDQIFLLMYEPGGIELLYCLLMNAAYSIHFRCLILQVIAVALKTTKVYEKNKVRLRLQDVGMAGLVNRLEGIPVSIEMIKLLVDQVLLTDNVASYQGLLVVLYFIRFTDSNLKLQAARQVSQAILLNSHAPHLIALQHSWYDCLIQLLVRAPRSEHKRDLNNADASDKLFPAATVGGSFVPNRERVGELINISGTPVHSSGVSKSIEESSVTASPKTKTPQYFRSQVFDYDTQSLGTRSMPSSKASSLDDLSISQANDTFRGQGSFEAGSFQDDERPDDAPLLDGVEMAEVTTDCLSTFIPINFIDTEDELCHLVTNIVFTVMWKGISGTDQKAWRERGQVFCRITYLDSNYKLYESPSEIKRRILEFMLNAVISDLKEPGQSILNVTENALEVMKWAYDLVVLDESQGPEKLSGKLLSGILGLLDTLLVFDETTIGDEWAEMAQMGLGILLECAASENVDICAMATPKLHNCIQTRMTRSKIEEVFFLLESLDVILTKAVNVGNQEHYLYIIPLVKALLATTEPRLHLARHLPSLPSSKAGPSFAEDFQKYFQSAEWRQSIEQHVKPFSQRHRQLTIQPLREEMKDLWTRCSEDSKVEVHMRNREWGESHLRFQSSIMEPFSNKSIEEQSLYNNVLSQAKNQNLLVNRRWRLSKLFLRGSRGPWRFRNEHNLHWKLSYHENISRMRLKLVLNHHFDIHAEASRLRETDKPATTQLQLDSLSLALACDARTDSQQDDSITEEDLKALAISEIQEVELTGKEKSVLTEECELLVLMSVVKGRVELTTTHVYFFDASPVRDDVERYDFKFPLSLLRHVLLRRYTFRRTALEFFLLDQTNYFLNFSTKSRNRIYSRILGLRPPNLVYTSGSPADVLRLSGVTQRWVQREISNFDYLMVLNTTSGRTYNDLGQYPVFPWILNDYTSETLDFKDPKIYRDLSKPIGIVNPNNVETVKYKYEQSEDVFGSVPKFHYGTHFSHSGGVLHYLVRLEPFTSLHIELQSGRFDVADRQFHSIPGTWKMLMNSPNDVMELIPEFFCLPEFLVNMNGFDLGRLQGSGEIIGDVVLPKWANTPEEFIYKHRKALESDYVSSHLHEWIDLVFGYKQKGPAAVEALNVFYYSTYEGAVNLDLITDPSERASIEGSINNFGQTPSQLFKEPHPAKMSQQDVIEKLCKYDNRGINLLLFPNNLRLFEVEMSKANDPVLFLSTSRGDARFGPGQITTIDNLVTIAESGSIGIHNFLPYNKNISNFFTLDLDPTLNNARTQHKIQGPLQPGISVSSNLFVVTRDLKCLYSGGHWDNSIWVYRISKNKICAHLVSHKDVVTCLAIDNQSLHLMSGSRDLTCIIWDISMIQTNSSGKDMPAKRLQVLYGHEAEVTCVALVTELDMAVSGSKDGSINIYSVREGFYLRTIWPNLDSLRSEISFMAVSDTGHIVTVSSVTTDDTAPIQVRHMLDVVSVNGIHLWKDTSTSALTALTVSGDFVVTGNARGHLNIHELYQLKLLKSLTLPSPIRHVTMANRNTHILASLQNGKLMVVGVALPFDLK